MRALILLAVLMGLAAPAQAQDIPSGVLSLVERLEAARNAPQMMADGKAAAPKPVLGLIGPAYPSAAGDKVEAPAAAGWVYYRLSVCGAAIVGGNEYTFIITTSGLAAASSSTHAIGVVAANCSSGRTFAVYVEADGQTVTAIGSFVSG